MGLKDTKSDECKRLLKGWNTGKDMNEFWNLWKAVQVFLGLVAGAEGPTLGLRLFCCLLEIPNTFILGAKASGTAQQHGRPGASAHTGLASLPPLAEWDCLPFSKSWLWGPSSLPTLPWPLHVGWPSSAVDPRWPGHRRRGSQSLASLCPWALTCGEGWWPSLVCDASVCSVHTWPWASCPPCLQNPGYPDAKVKISGTAGPNEWEIDIPTPCQDPLFFFLCYLISTN